MAVTNWSSYIYFKQIKNMSKIIYLSELTLPSTSAQTLQILKMCDGFSKYRKVTLIIKNSKNDLKFSTLKNNYNLKNNFDILNVNYKKDLNFLTRIYFAIKILLLFKKKNVKFIFFSRSVISSIIFSIFGKKNILEFHQENYGFTKILFNLFRKTFFYRNLKFILIHKNLNNHFKFEKKKFLILDDGVDIDDFKNLKKPEKKSLACVYTGSFYKGKGVELIQKISKSMKDIKFYLYGDDSTLDTNIKKNFFLNNMIFKGNVNYFQIPKILNKFEIILMPYLDKVYVRSKQAEVSKYMSPLKLFDYLSSDGIIIASNHHNYKHILKNNHNCFLINSDKPILWMQKIREVLKNPNTNRLSKIRQNARITVSRYTWKNRARKIINFVEPNNV